MHYERARNVRRLLGENRMDLKTLIKKVENHIFNDLRRIGIFNYLSDEAYIRLNWRRRMHYRLNLDNPQTYNEKLQWLKLHDRKPEYTQMVDKYEVKQYVADKIGAEYIIPTLGVWDRFEDIDFNSLPNQFVLKCTHDSGGLVICRDKDTLDLNNARKKINNSLKRNYYYSGREWPYKNVKPRIIAEQYMEDPQSGDLRDYKIFVFNGVAKVLFVASERQKVDEETKFDFFDVEFNHLPFTNGHPNAKIEPKKPRNFEQMLRLAEKLSENIPQLRVDFYEIENKIYFGELTFFHWGGMMPFEPEEWDRTLGEWITLPADKQNG